MKFGNFVSLSTIEGSLTEEALVTLESIEVLADQDVQIVARLEAGDIAQAVFKFRPDLKRQSMAIAVAILERLKAAGYGSVAEVNAGSTLPQEIIIKQPLTIATMSLRELIELALHDPDRKTEAWGQLMKTPEVLKATQRTEGLAWVVNGVMDVGRTIAYISTMGDPLTRKQLPDREKGERLLTLGEALAIETRCYLHPLDGSMLRGADEFGIDWTKELDSETHKAALYSLGIRSKLHPGFGYEAAQGLLKGGAAWSLIIGEYWAAIDRGDMLAKGVEIYKEVPQGKPPVTFAADISMSKRTPSDEGQSHSPDDSFYEKLVREQCIGTEHITSHSRTVQAGVYSSILIAAHSTTISRGVVFLNDCSIAAHSVHGSVICPPGKRVVVTAHSVNITEKRCKTWHEVATLAGLI